MAKETKFETKSEVMTALDKLGVEYAKYKSGKREGQARDSFDLLCELYKANTKKKSGGSEKSKQTKIAKEKEVVITEDKPVFHRPVRSFNPMTFSFN